MEHFNELKATQIFKDMSEFDAQAMMFCLKTKFKTFDKHAEILSQGDPLEEVVLILKGSANVENVDSMGDISILMRLKKGDTYGVEMAYAGIENHKNSVIATEKTLVLFMNKHRLITPCQNRCKRHDYLIKNLMQQVASKNFELVNKLTHMSKKTIRDKLLSYFSLMCDNAHSKYFEIPFTKTELASYLSVDRSAMSSELSKMKKEGIIDYEKKQFHLINHKFYEN